jgi:hypothetical protein
MRNFAIKKNTQPMFDSRPTLQGTVKNALLKISMCILRYLPSRRTLQHYVERALQFYMFPCSHENIFFLRIDKEVRKSKESCLHKGEFPILMYSREVQEHPQAHTLGVPLPQETTLI